MIFEVLGSLLSGLVATAGEGLAGAAGSAISGAGAEAAGGLAAGLGGAGAEAAGAGLAAGALETAAPAVAGEMTAPVIGPGLEEAANMDFALENAMGAEAANAENPKGFLASAWDSVKGTGEQMWNQGKQDVQKLIDSQVVRNPEGGIDGWRTGGNVGYNVLKSAATRALGNAKNDGGLLEQQPFPGAETKAPQARTKDADEALKELMNMMHNS